MTSYVLTFRSRSDHISNESEGAEWLKWFQQLGDAIIDPGSRVGATASLGDAPTRTVMTGFAVVSTGDLDAAVRLARRCPGLTHGGAVEVGEILAMD